MTKGEVLALYRHLNQMGGLKGVKFSYAVSKNLNLLKDEVESIDKTLENTETFQKYEYARLALAEKNALKDDDGKPKTETAPNGVTSYVMPTDTKVFDKAFEELKKTHKDALDAREKQEADYTTLLTTDSDITPYKLKLEDVPEDISASQMNGIFHIVDEK